VPARETGVLAQMCAMAREPSRLMRSAAQPEPLEHPGLRVKVEMFGEDGEPHFRAVCHCEGTARGDRQGFIKKTEKAPTGEIDLALQRVKELKP
jgi:hypothetical protein